ncbi:hypothetical protein C8Q80DRAFT_113110 [Daedaleopsis nitida]|nr:hypothetical protein C8Q80DRAFT_113110 [Daedaleopsis nitida]
MSTRTSTPRTSEHAGQVDSVNIVIPYGTLLVDPALLATRRTRRGPVQPQPEACETTNIFLNRVGTRDLDDLEPRSSFLKQSASGDTPRTCRARIYNDIPRHTTYSPPVSQYLLPDLRGLSRRCEISRTDVTTLLQEQVDTPRPLPVLPAWQRQHRARPTATNTHNRSLLTTPSLRRPPTLTPFRPGKVARPVCCNCSNARPASSLALTHLRRRTRPSSARPCACQVVSETPSTAIKFSNLVRIRAGLLSCALPCPAMASAPRSAAPSSVLSLSPSQSLSLRLASLVLAPGSWLRGSLESLLYIRVWRTAVTIHASLVLYGLWVPRRHPGSDAHDDRPANAFDALTRYAVPCTAQSIRLDSEASRPCPRTLGNCQTVDSISRCNTKTTLHRPGCARVETQ